MHMWKEDEKVEGLGFFLEIDDDYYKLVEEF